MNKKKDLSQEDKKTWEDYIKDPSDIYDKDKKIKKKLEKKDLNLIFMVSLLDEANKKVKEIIIFLYQK